MPNEPSDKASAPVATAAAPANTPDPAAAQCTARSLACADVIGGLERATLLDCTDPGALSDAMRSNFEFRAVGRVETAEVTTGPLDIATSGTIGDEGRITAWVQLRGSASIEQGERAAALDTGDLCFLRSARPLKARLAEHGRLMLISVPESEVADRFPLWRTALVRRIPVGAGVPAVFLDAVRSLYRWRDSLDEAGSDGLADAVVDLIGAVICFAAPDDSGCVRRSLQQRERVKRFAQQNLRNPELNVDLIAAAVDLSPRQVHRLFADESLSVMRWIWTQRLEQCYRELTRAPGGQRSVSDIAFAWGFNDQAHFSRAFRRQFGITPREARQRREEPS